MSSSTIHASVVDAMAVPRLVWLRPNLIGLAFPLMKLLPARFILRRAMEQGDLQPGGMVVESCSGSFGLALAMAARIQGHPLTLISDPRVNPSLRLQAEQLGARVQVPDTPDPGGGYTRARLAMLERVLAENADAFCPRLDSNPHNPGSYGPCAEQLAHAVGAMGTVDCLIGTVGSGGSVCGTAAYLRLLYPELEVVGVDGHRSVTFGRSDAEDGPVLEGMGSSRMPLNVDHTAFDWVHWIGAAEAMLATRQLYRDHALYMGPTSGAAYLVADWWARANPDLLGAVLLPDEGSHYRDTVYDDAWLAGGGVGHEEELPREPVEWGHPRQGGDAWSCFRWGRRFFAEAMASPADAAGEWTPDEPEVPGEEEPGLGLLPSRSVPSPLAAAHPSAFPSLPVRIELPLEEGCAYLNRDYVLSVTLPHADRGGDEEITLDVLADADDALELLSDWQRTLAPGPHPNGPGRVSFLVRPVREGTATIRLTFFVQGRWCGTQSLHVSCVAEATEPPAALESRRAALPWQVA